MLGRPIVSTNLRTAVTGTYFVWFQQFIADTHLQSIVGLGIERRPTKIPGWDKSRINHHGNLKQKKRGTGDDFHNAVLILTQCYRP
jgi:hypothetical protein